MAISNWSTTAGLNVLSSGTSGTGGTNIDEGCAPSGINNAIRDIMSQLATFVAAPAFTGSLTLTSTDAGATAGPTVTLYRNSATPAASDILGKLLFQGEDSGGNTEDYAEIYASISDTTATSEDANLLFRAKVAGTMTTHLTLAPTLATFSGAVTVSGAFTSLGIDDNATGERLQLADTLLTYGTAGADFTIAGAANDRTFVLSGGNAAGAGSDFVLYGGAHATTANDFQLRAAGDAVIAWDDSAATLYLSADAGTQRLQLTATALSPVSNDGAALGISGTAWADLFLASAAVINFNAGNYTLTHSAGLLTASGGLTVSGAFTSLGIDDNATGERLQIADTMLTYGTAGADFTIAGAANDRTFILSGGNAAGSGSDLVLYGGTHATTANDVQLRSAGDNIILWDDSAATLFLYADAGTQKLQLTSANLSPTSNDGLALGTTSLGWADLHGATGFTLNVANGDWVATHTTGIVTVGTGDLRVTTAGANAASVVTVGGTQTLTGKTLTSPTLGTSPTAAGATWPDLGTVTTADINGGTIDGVTIGGSSAGAGTFTTLTTSGAVTFRQADDGASQGPTISLDRNSASPTSGDVLAFLVWQGRDSGAAAQNYAGIRSTILDTTAASEDGTLDLVTVVAGTVATRAQIAQGLYMTGATDPGAGKIAATGFVTGGAITLTANDAGALGASGTAFSDLFLAAGGVINWNAGGITATETSDVLVFAGATAYTHDAPVGLQSYTVASVPSAATAGRMIYVSNETGGAVPAFSDGTNWRRVTDRAVVS